MQTAHPSGTVCRDGVRMSPVSRPAPVMCAYHSPPISASLPSSQVMLQVQGPTLGTAVSDDSHNSLLA